VLKGICIQNLKVNAQPALPQDETIASTHWTLGTFVQLSSRPLRQLARVREQVPYTLHWHLDDFGGTYFHREFSLFQVRIFAHDQPERENEMPTDRARRLICGDVKTEMNLRAYINFHL